MHWLRIKQYKSLVGAIIHWCFQRMAKYIHLEEITTAN